MKASINAGKVTVNNRKFFERDLQNNSKKFTNNLKATPGECYCNAEVLGSAIRR